MSAKLTTFTHIIDQQDRAEQLYLEAYKNGNYTIHEPFVKVNPYLIAPLTAVVMFPTEESVAVCVTVHGKEKAQDFSFNYKEATEHVLCIYGLYADYDNKVTITTSAGETTQLTISTGVAPKNLQPVVTMEVEEGLMDGELIFVVPTAQCSLTAGYDAAGDCRWYSEEAFSYHFNRGNNGRIMVGAPYLLAPPYSATTLFEMGLIGKVYKEYRIPRGYHHNYVEMEDGNLLMLTQNIEMGTSGDLIALVDRESAEILKEWDLKEILPQEVAGSGSQDMHDWFHNNAIWYDKETHTLTLSGRHQDIIININYEDGSLNWMLGDPEGWPEDYTSKYFLKPVGDLEWAYEPHAVKYLANGDLMCFDSGHYRSKNSETYVAPENNYSRAVVYRINTEAKTVEQVWDFGKDLGSSFYSTYMGDLTVYGEAHYGIHSGGSAYIEGKAIDMPGVLKKDLDDRTQLSATTIEMKQGKQVLKLVMDMNSYQARRIALQDEREQLVFGKGEKLGNFAPTEEFPVEMDTIDAGMITDDYNLNFGYDGERLFIRGDFLKGEMVMLHLKSEEETHTFYIQSTRRPFYTMCFFTFGDGDARPVEWPITVADFNGLYKMTLTINDKTYSTGLVLDLRKEA